MKDRRSTQLRCFFCGKAVTKNTGCISIYDRETGQPFHSIARPCFEADGTVSVWGSLAYPGRGPNLVAHGKWRDYDRIAVFTHRECGPDCEYWFSLDRLSEDWITHLREKKWHCPAIDEAIERARKAFGVTPRGGA